MNNFLTYVTLTFSYHSIVNFHAYRRVQGHPNPNSPLVLGRLRAVVGFGDVLEWMDNMVYTMMASLCWGTIYNSTQTVCSLVLVLWTLLCIPFDKGACCAVQVVCRL